MNNNESITYTKYNEHHYNLLKLVVYEAIYWRKSDDIPTFSEVMEMEHVKKVFLDFPKRKGDLGITAIAGEKPCGIAFIRYWTEDNNIRGYITPEIPVLVIAVDKKYRKMKIATGLIQNLCKEAKEKGISKISLCVSKDNIALGLYKKTGFKEYKDIGDSLLMVKEL